MTAPSTLTALVSGEDAAIYAYSVGGARVVRGGRRRALAQLEIHRANRDRAASLVVAAGGTPPGSAVAYTLPGPVDSPKAARALMAEVDNRLVGLYADAAAVLTDADRRWAVRTAATYATSAVTWGADPQAFPVGTQAPAATPPATTPSSAAAPSASGPALTPSSAPAVKLSSAPPTSTPSSATAAPSAQ